jgi:CubicO group peptidase (beta-lactamase class C family)
MIVLGRLVEQVAGRPLDVHLRETVFGPLGMKDTGYDPEPSRCAPTSSEPPGRVHDPLARAYRTKDRAPGNAGLFSTGDDLALFLRELLGGRVLKPATVDLLFTPNRAAGADTRGLGWDVFDESPYAPGAGHTGYTGTLLWIDSSRDRFLVLLTNRVYPDDKAVAGPLRREVLSIVNR